MKTTILSYTAPAINTYEVAAEQGYSASVTLPGMGVQPDDFVTGGGETTTTTPEA